MHSPDNVDAIHDPQAVDAKRFEALCPHWSPRAGGAKADELNLQCKHSTESELESTLQEERTDACG